MNRLLHCAHCHRPLPVEPAAAAQLTACPGCRRPLRLAVFPALQRPAAPAAGADLAVVAGEAACFYHATWRAQVPCDQCGRFLCSLCDLNLGERHLCPACVEAGARTRTLEPLERARVRHDLVVWHLLVLPLLLCGVLVPVTAPLAVIWALATWRAKPSRVDNTRAWLMAGIVFGSLQIIGAVVVIYLSATGYFE